MPLRPLIVFGTRSEAVKMAPVVQACHDRHSQVEPIVCVTAQHREMLDQAIGYFGIRPDVDLDLMRPNQTLADFTGRCVTALDDVLANYQPDCVVVQGDTATTTAGALAAFYQHVPLVHVEAGLRTGNMQSPWPDELNRRVATLAASLHCAPSEHARENLLREQVPATSIVLTGSTVVDALLETVRRERGRDAFWNAKHDYLAGQRTVLVTAHRHANQGEPLARICRAVLMLAAEFPDVQFVFPMHLNPQVQGPVSSALLRHADENVHLLEPVAYPEFVWLMNRSSLIISDSGGVHEEATTLGKRVLVTCETTERPELLEAGRAELVGADVRRIIERAGVLLLHEHQTSPHAAVPKSYGDGHAAERIVDEMLGRFVAADAGVRLRIAA